jgi:ABC-type glycerol-3-phosphate transport system substrate-binding protein
MKLLFSLTAAVALLAACGNEASTTGKSQTDSIPATAIIDTLDRFDTITANGYTILLQPAT